MLAPLRLLSTTMAPRTALRVPLPSLSLSLASVLPAKWSSALPAAAAATTTTTPRPQTLTEWLREAWSTLLAAPKKRLSHRRKALRKSSNMLRPLRMFQTCWICGTPHRQGILCPSCFNFNSFLRAKAGLKGTENLEGERFLQFGNLKAHRMGGKTVRKYQRGALGTKGQRTSQYE